ncbi:hypothetical protein NS220_02605 [Microbacterium testaceum]|uniref:HTH araC/xylS-type domain-containing protein n=1 Tax=Microbacterium testaceum TaxID=2033 RepID=A0A147F0H1_MICTE|nr:hypothetical protein NS220_02605 [Microbacterium testaceum]
MTQEESATELKGPMSPVQPPRVALLGAAAQRWFTTRGWHAEPLAGSDPLRVFADEVSVDSFMVRRVWHTAAVLTPIAPRLAAEPQPGILLQVEGDLTVDSFVSDPVRLSAGGSARIGPGILPAYRAPQSTARIEVRSRSRLATAREVQGVLAVDTLTSSWRLLANTVNALLNGEVDTDADSFTAVQSAIEYLASAVASEIAPVVPPAERDTTTTAFTRLRLRSEHVIHRHANSPEFTVAVLADKLGVSRSYLARAYVGTDTTPSERIRAVRLELAAGASADVSGETRATRAGFSSSRAFKRAERASGTRLAADR